MKIEISKLNQHPYNRRIYGYDDNTELTEKIKSSGWIKPILITKNCMIISGHRRVEACKNLKISEIEYELVDDDPLKQLELFVSENCYRVKTTSQLMKESEIYHEIEEKKSYQRMKSGMTPETNVSQGRTTEIVSKKIGLGETSYKKGRKVLEYVKDNPEFEWIFDHIMNQSIDKSVHLTEKSPEFIAKIIDKVAGDKDKILPVIRELEKEEYDSKAQKTPLPPGRFGVIIIDLSQREPDDLIQTDISSICEQDSLLFVWVKPKQLESGLGICKNWGFRYSTCLIWNKDKNHDVSFNSEILLISTKGNPAIKFKQFNASSEKPLMVEEIIKKGYPEISKVEILLGEGWKIW